MRVHVLPTSIVQEVMLAGNKCVSHFHRVKKKKKIHLLIDLVLHLPFLNSFFNVCRFHTHLVAP